MAETGADGGARVLSHSYHYNVGDAWIQHRIDEEGVEPPKKWWITFELRELKDADSRRRARRLREAWEVLSGTVELREPTEDPERFLDTLELWIASALQDEVSEGESQEQGRRRKLADFESEMTDWIERNGSSRLKLAHSRNYKVTSGYAKARAREELPGCWVDTAGKAEYRERVDPSLRALGIETSIREWIEAKELDLGTRIIWLTEPPSSMKEYNEEGKDFFELEEFRQQEALLIPDYLGKYDVFYPIDIDEREPGGDDADPEEEA